LLLLLLESGDKVVAMVVVRIVADGVWIEDDGS
jgi:hypothetical protein